MGHFHVLISWMLSWEIYRYITTLCLNGTLPCVDFMDVIMGDIPIYNLTTLCLNGTLPCADFMDVIMGDIPIYNLTTLCLNGTLPCADFMDVIMGDIPIYNHTVFEWDTSMCWFHGGYHGGCRASRANWGRVWKPWMDWSTSGPGSQTKSSQL